MSKRNTFRPTVGDMLEDRAVPTGFGGIAGIGQTAATAAVRQAFQAFERQYATDVRNVLYGTGGPSTTTRAAFDTAVSNDLTTLTNAVNTALASNPTVAAQVNATITGSGTNTLQSQLNALTTPTTGRGASSRFTSMAVRLVERVGAADLKIVQSASTPAGSVDTTTLRNVLRSVDQAFSTYRSSLATNVSTNLYASGGPNATTRAAFDAQNVKDVATLKTAVTTAIAPLPASVQSSLTSTLSNDLQTLQTNMTNLTTPGSGFVSRLLFRVRTAFVSGRSQVQVDSDIASAVRTYNQGLA